MKFLFVTLLCLILSACKVGPDYVRPKVTTPTQFTEAPKGFVVANPKDNFDRGQWWKIFNDPELNSLEDKLNISNQNIIEAAAQYHQSLALVSEARASYFPTVDASAFLTRQKLSNSSTIQSANTNHSLNLDASWEPDLWGNVGRTVEAAKASSESKAAQLALIRLSEQAALAQFYFELRALDKDQKLLDDTVSSYQQSLQMTKNRYEAGVSSLSDIVQAQTQLETAQASALNNGINRAKYVHAIAVLIGIPPESYNWNFQPLTATPPKIPLTVPSLILQRRPDIAEAEREVAQANAQIGIAISAFFPDLSLSASGGFVNKGLGPWISSLPTLGWAVGPMLAENLFDGGQRIAATQAARANYEATVAHYRQTVLSAFQDVEDNLSAVKILESQSKLQNKSADDARLALRLITNQYKAGTASYTDVVTAQIAAYSQEKAAIDTQALWMTSTVRLIKALGGGWDGDTLNMRGEIK